MAHINCEERERVKCAAYLSCFHSVLLSQNQRIMEPQRLHIVILASVLDDARLYTLQVAQFQTTTSVCESSLKHANSYGQRL